jgi:hypothetical protein
MLRPTPLLPPRGRLLTPRSGREISPSHLGPATGLSGDYPCGTHTRWLDAACSRPLQRLRAFARGFFRTHHARMIEAPAAFREAPQRNYKRISFGLWKVPARRRSSAVGGIEG